MAAGSWCPITEASRVIGRKWELIVIDRLLDGPKRFGEIRKSVTGLSGKVLSDCLLEMEKGGIVRRRVISSRPVLIEYGLTKKGADLRTLLTAMRAWGEKWLTAPQGTAVGAHKGLRKSPVRRT